MWLKDNRTMLIKLFDIQNGKAIPSQNIAIQ